MANCGSEDKQSQAAKISMTTSARAVDLTNSKHYPKLNLSRAACLLCLILLSVSLRDGGRDTEMLLRWLKSNPELYYRFTIIV